MSEEADVDPIYQQLIAQSSEDDTTYAERLFNIGWDLAPHRVIKNSTTIAWEKAGCPAVMHRPNENEVIAYKKNGQPILRYSDDGPILGTIGKLEALALYAGQTAGLLSQSKPTSQIMADLINDLQSEFARLKKTIE